MPKKKFIKRSQNISRNSKQQRIDQIEKELKQIKGGQKKNHISLVQARNLLRKEKHSLEQAQRSAEKINKILHTSQSLQNKEISLTKLNPMTEQL